MTRGALAFTLLLCSGCYAKAAETPSAAVDPGDPVQFSFGTLEGQELSSDTTRGRTTALLFVTTYDLPSQAEAQLLRDELLTHKPRANAGIVMLEPPHAAPLVQVWRESLRLELPVAMASQVLLSGESQLGQVRGVPTLIVLDRSGRLVFRHEGALSRAEIAEGLRRADAR